MSIRLEHWFTVRNDTIVLRLVIVEVFMARIISGRQTGKKLDRSTSVDSWDYD